MSTVDNFSLIRPHLEFLKAHSPDGRETVGSFDRYIVQIIRRGKDFGKGYNFSRLVKTYAIPSVEYFDKKADSIRETCVANGARAYFLPQVRSSRECLKEAARLALEGLDVPSVNLARLMNAAMCGLKRSRKKTFVIDADAERYDAECVADILVETKAIVGENGRNEDDVYCVPTPNGFHIVSPAFDRAELVRRRPDVLPKDILPDGATVLFFGGVERWTGVEKDVHGRYNGEQ